MATTKYPNGIEGPLTGDVTGNITGNITGDVAGNVTGNVTGNVAGTLTGGQKDAITVITGDGAVAVAPGSTHLTKGSAAAITIAAPTVTTHDGYIVRITSETSFAHVITCPVGFNGKGSSGTITFAASPASVTLEARNAKWWVISNIAGTIA
jgi:hypothetical protein